MTEQQKKSLSDTTYAEFIQDILCTRGRFSCGDEYHERHHITPKCMGGTNEENNLIDLFAREHFIAHKMLAQENPDNRKLLAAWWRMCNWQDRDKEFYEPTPEEYEEARIAFVKSISGENNPFYGKNLSDEHKQKISKANKGKIFSIEHCKKISESRIGINNPNYGKSPSEETRIKISNANKGKIVSEETRKKLSEANKGLHTGTDNAFYGKRHSEETKEKIRQAANGRPSPNKGTKSSEETRRKISEHHADVSGTNNPRARRVIRLCDLKIFNTIKDAAIEEGVSHGGMRYMCNNQQGFMYYDKWLTVQNNCEELINE